MLNLRQYADVSTRHISPEDDERLHRDAVACDERATPSPGDRLEHDFIVFEYDAGYFVHTGVAEDPEHLRLLAGRYSPELLDLVRRAYEQDAVFLRLDRDGDVYEGLREFDW